MKLQFPRVIMYKQGIMWVRGDVIISIFYQFKKHSGNTNCKEDSMPSELWHHCWKLMTGPEQSTQHIYR